MERYIECINPATGQVWDTLKIPSAVEIEIMAAKAREAFQDWSVTPLAFRKQIVARFGELVQENLEHLAQLLTKETGKPITQSRREIRQADRRIRFFLDIADRYLAPEVAYEDEKVREEIAYEPLGLIVNISAWNYPYNIGYNVFIPALLAGNVVLYKPSEYTPHTGLEFQDLFRSAGLPPHVFTTIIGNGQTGAYLTERIPADGYFFTGSHATGMKILEQCRKRTVPIQLELGGKDPAYVANDVKDLRKVAAALADGAFYNNGQSCCAVERIYVHTEVYTDFLKHFVQEVKGFILGDPRNESTYIGPLTRAAQLDILERQVADALSKGARLLLGGKRIPREGNWFEPTVLADCSHQMEVMKEESFGPIIGIMGVKDDEEAINLMNDTPYGLTAAVYSSNPDRARRIMEKLNTGTVYFNMCDRVSPYVPWSGRGHSGLGLTLSYHGLRAFTRTKSYQLLKSN
ncbi:MAG: aldehyde dehydrogenase family protein [Flavobacteriales bacterium]|nr:aldehyde dehydrogenase family protein [Flavobacteriales bacterium]MDW8409582.1 aldehyde dehydrogenase family protein [Flavobacteriales bacterium]